MGPEIKTSVWPRVGNEKNEKKNQKEAENGENIKKKTWNKQTSPVAQKRNQKSEITWRRSDVDFVYNLLL